LLSVGSAKLHFYNATVSYIKEKGIGIKLLPVVSPTL
jgi:hypothetical protein